MTIEEAKQTIRLLILAVKELSATARQSVEYSDWPELQDAIKAGENAIRIAEKTMKK